MNISGNTILITGGGSGIGKALATRFLDRGNEVIVCGRSKDILDQLVSQHPQIQIRVCDIALRKEREALVQWSITEFPSLNVLVNNAGIQKRIDLTQSDDLQDIESEITINLQAPIRLCQLLQRHFVTQDAAAFVNVTSGLSFVPLANVPVYCATKAALHSFTLSLRWQLRETSVEVIEIIPPAVDTDLQAPGLHKFGVDVDEFADHVFAELEKGESEIAYGTALAASRASREELNEIYERMNGAFH